MRIDPEIWKLVPDFTGYEVSNYGQVRSYKKFGLVKNNELNLIYRIRKLQKGTNGYWGLLLYKDKKRYFFGIANLVLITFIGPCPDGMEVCHENGDKSKNNLTNLRYDTRKNNHKDKLIHKTEKFGEDRWSSKFTNKDIKQIIKLYNNGNGLSQGTLTKMFNISQPHISNIVNKKRRTNDAYLSKP